MDTVLRYPSEQLAHADVLGRRKHIGIIGAGIAGLIAAYELEQAGHTVRVFESSSRMGGRIRTHTFADGTIGELGAMRIPSNHACTLHYVRQFGITMRPFVNRNTAAYYLMRGRKARIDEWTAVAQRYNLAPRERKDPQVLFEQSMTSAMTRLNSGEKWGLFSGALTGLPSEYDAISLRQYMTRLRISDEAFEYIGHANGMMQYERASFLECLIDYFGLQRVAQFELVGGMESLVQAVSQRLRCQPELETTVTDVTITDEGAVIGADHQGAPMHTAFDYVLCATPAAPTARIRFEPSLSSQKMQALRGLYHASAAKTLVHTTSRPWEMVDGIYGGGSFSDMPFQQCWYPSDNARSRSGEQLASYTGAESPLEAFAHAPSHWVRASADRSREAGVLTASYTWENNARRMAALSPHDRTTEVLRAIETLHPGIGAVVDDVVHMTWDHEPSPGSGAFAYFAPGEHARYFAHLIAPHPPREPRVFFAGEHVSLIHAWLQGSIESALTQVVQILKAPAGSMPASGRDYRDEDVRAWT